MITQYTQGKASICFPTPVYIQSTASIVGKKEGEGPLKDNFDMICEDSMFGCDTWEAAESSMQKEAATLAVSKAGLKPEDIRMVFAGDLLAQTVASSFGIAGMEIPFYGLYGACSTMGESLSIGAMTIAGGYGEYVLCATSSHFASAEKEFRFPLGYGNQRPLSATWTTTGSGACVLSCFPPNASFSFASATSNTAARRADKHAHTSATSNTAVHTADKKTHTSANSSDSVQAPANVQPLCQNGYCAAITGITTGKLVDFGLKDSMNMGACMAPAACDTIYRNLQDFGRSPEDYDAIITGDLGSIGQEILLELLRQKGYNIHKQHKDCGLIIYDNEKQDTHSGGSGCGCSAVVLAAHILPKIISGEWKRILFVPTGALLSKVSFNEGDTIPGIAHGVVIERFPMIE